MSQRLRRPGRVRVPDQREQEKPRFGVRLSRGIVTYVNDQPLVTYEQADEARAQIAELLNEDGTVEKVYSS